MHKSLNLLVAGLIGLSLACVATATQSDELQIYDGNTIVCQDVTNLAVCRIFLNADGTYEAFYFFGKQPKMPEADGPFEQEGREGTYVVARAAGQSWVCIKPAPVGVSMQMETGHEFFGEEACYALSAHKLGDKWTQRSLGKQFTLWLLEGR